MSEPEARPIGTGLGSSVPLMLSATALIALMAMGTPPAALSQAPAAAKNAPTRRPTTSADAKATRTNRRVMLLFEEATQKPAVALLDQVIRQRLGADSSRRVELFEEHLGLTGAEGKSVSQLTYQYIRRKYAAQLPEHGLSKEGQPGGSAHLGADV